MTTSTGPLQFDNQGGDEEQERDEDEPLMERPMDPTSFSILEADLSIKIEEEQDPILKANMQWEKRIIHSANNQFFEYGDSYKYFHTPTLPLPLLKLESEACAIKLKPDCPEEETGGYAEVNVDEWRNPKTLQHQPNWRRNWFRKHPSTINAYAQAPRELRINPTFCPCIRKRSWPQFQRFLSTRPSYLNYPILCSPPPKRRPTEYYMLHELENTIELYKAVLDLACLMLVKICKMLITAITTFQNSAATNAPWTRFFEGSQGLCWDLSITLDYNILMGLYARIQFLPSHFLLTFEECFYTGFFEHAQPSRIFSPLVTDHAARYIAFSAAEDKNPHALQLMSYEQQLRLRQWEAGLKKIQQDEYRDQEAGPSNE